jgi:hypothetical protein
VLKGEMGEDLYRCKRFKSKNPDTGPNLKIKIFLKVTKRKIQWTSIFHARLSIFMTVTKRKM